MSNQETILQNNIEAAIGSLPDLLVLRNSGGLATHINKRTGKEWRVPYGLGSGSPDIVCILAPAGRWCCLEVKVPGAGPEPHQIKCHELWREFGAFVATVTSVDEARDAVERARKGESK